MSAPAIHTVRFEPLGVEMEVEEGETVLDAAFRQGMAQPRRPMAPIVVRPAPTAYGVGGEDEEHRPLSTREHEVMHWVRLGKTNSEIASIMNLSTFTVQNHMRRIYKKLDVLNRAQAVGQMGAMA